MSVYTAIDQNTVIGFLDDFELGTLVDLSGISNGIENTNYSLTTNQCQCILTIIEQYPLKDCQWFVDLNKHLRKHNFLAPEYYHNKNNEAIIAYKNKALVIVERFKGVYVQDPAAIHISQIGEAVAKLHNITESFPSKRPNTRNEEWRCNAINKLKPKITDDEFALLTVENDFQKSNPILLPTGIIHGDLFRDNVLYQNNIMQGVIDYYYACDHFYMYELAVMLNDWCFYEGCYNKTLSQILLSSYEKHRELSDAEYDALPQLLRLAALRFYVSRLYDQHFPRYGFIANPHDPTPMRTILEQAQMASLETFGI